MAKQILHVETIKKCADCPHINTTQLAAKAATYPFFCGLMPVGKPAKKLLITDQNIPDWCPLEESTY